MIGLLKLSKIQLCTLKKLRLKKITKNVSQGVEPSEVEIFQLAGTYNWTFFQVKISVKFLYICKMILTRKHFLNQLFGKPWVPPGFKKLV